MFVPSDLKEAKDVGAKSDMRKSTRYIRDEQGYNYFDEPNIKLFFFFFFFFFFFTNTDEIISRKAK